ncbi:MAG: hypothetical protein ABL962_18975 [Fimbriimonadaceae bacterium]
MIDEFRFSELRSRATLGYPGFYEILLNSGTPLKCGIASNLFERLRDHGASRQSGLKLKDKGNWSRPSDVKSKKSILAKHLYFDEQIAPSYNLKIQGERQRFLEECCKVRVRITESIESARALERDAEASGAYRYVGSVLLRSTGER